MRSIKVAILITILANVFVFGSSLGQDASTVSANPAPNSCQPYGPKPGYQYDPKMLMDRMGVPRDNHPGPFLSAHRGVWGVWDSSESRVPNKIAPENSIAAIDNAAALKFEMVELDVKLTADKELVLMHDYTMGRTTNWGVSKGKGSNWMPFEGELSNGDKPQSIPDWPLLHEYNPLVSNINLSDIQGVTLRAFDKNSSVSLGVFETESYNNTIMIEALGAWITTTQTVPTLLQALQHIGNNYPGMTVVLDLRHAEEVKEAIMVIDQVEDCEGNPAREWVILKPFANVFIGGIWNAEYMSSVADPHEESLYCYFRRWFISEDTDYQKACKVSTPLGLYKKYYDYKWIPVVSNRLSKDATGSSEATIPGAPGPDTRRLTVDASEYLQDWGYIPYGSTEYLVTVEIGRYDGGLTDITNAYNTAINYRTNMQSWRPADIDSANEGVQVVDNGQLKTVSGFNWKDDGIGAYAVFEEQSRSYADARKYAGILTVDEALTVLEEEAATREMVQMSISKPVKDRIVSNVYYKLKNVAHNRLLSATPGNGYSTEGIPDNDTQYSEWQAYLMPNGHYILWNPKVNKLLTAVWTNPVLVSPDDGNYFRQYWKIEPNGDGTFRVVSTQTDELLTMGSNYVTNVQGFNTVANNQKWTLEPVPSAMYIWNTRNDKTLAVPDEELNTPVIMYTKYNSWYNEHWKLIRIEEPNKYNLYKIVNRNSGKVLGALYGDELDGTTVTIQNYTNQAHQKWRVVNNNNGSFKIVNEKSNKVLTTRKVDTRHSDEVENGDYVEIRSFVEGNRSQQWGMSILPQPY